MDALALLCTLHADGPSTLRRLRDAGCTSLEDLTRSGPKRVGELLEFPPAVARRFLREAEHLSGRLGGKELEEEEVMHAASTPERPSARLPRPVSVGTHETPAGDPGDHLDRKDRDLLQRVIDRWREMDLEEPAAPQAAAQNSSAETDAVLQEEQQEEQLQEGTRLELQQIDGLNQELLNRLGAAGIHSLEELVGSQAHEISLVTELPFTQLRRLQFSAQRFLSRCELLPRQVASAPAVEEERLSADLRPEPELLRETAEQDAGGAGGPFA